MGSSDPTHDPTNDPTEEPTRDPTADPSRGPSLEPTGDPTIEPTDDPTREPTADPTEDPTIDPTEDPTDEPTAAPFASQNAVETTLTPTSEPTSESIQSEKKASAEPGTSLTLFVIGALSLTIAVICFSICIVWYCRMRQRIAQQTNSIDVMRDALTPSESQPLSPKKKAPGPGAPLQKDVSSQDEKSADLADLYVDAGDDEL